MTIRCADCRQRYPPGVAENGPDPDGIRDNWQVLQPDSEGRPTYGYDP